MNSKTSADNFNQILWRDEFATGVEDMDLQHMILIHTLNEISQMVMRQENRQVLDQITMDLLTYSVYHFETEERLMRDYRYFDLERQLADEHIAQHRYFSQKMIDVRAELKSNSKIEINELIEFLNNWLTGHILNTDRNLGEFIRRQRGDNPPEPGDPGTHSPDQK